MSKLKQLVANKKVRIVLVVIILLMLLLAPSLYFYHKYEALKTQVPGASQVDVKAMVAKVGKHILLPTGEDPLIYTISDKEKLSGQPFYANAKKGDLVLVYQTAKKAYLYDQKADKVIEVGPVIIATPTPAQAASTTPTQAVPQTFAIYNGTTIVGLTKKYEPELMAKIPQAKVVARDNANKQTYAKTMLVDVTGKKPALALSFAQALGVDVYAMPKDESSPSADFLIIVGADKK